MIRMMLIGTVLVFAADAPADDRPDAVDQVTARDSPRLAGQTCQVIRDGLRFTEGPAAAPSGLIYFSDIPAQRIYRYNPQDKQISVFREQSGGANGLMFDSKGRLVACEGKARRVTRTESDGSITILAERYQGKRLNSPNDLVIDAQGGVYFTDPRYGRRDDMELDVEAVYYIRPDGTLLRIIDDLTRPNGIALSPDGRTLYVADHGDRRIVAYDLPRPAEPTRPRPLIDVKQADQRGGPDGMCVDQSGRLYIAGPGGIWIVWPDGKKLDQIDTPEQPTNCAFGGRDSNTLYITARQSFAKIRLQARGER
jgi:gluconolactonase